MMAITLTNQKFVILPDRGTELMVVAICYDQKIGELFSVIIIIYI